MTRARDSGVQASNQPKSNDSMTSETLETGSSSIEQTGDKACARCENMTRRRFVQTAAVATAAAATAGTVSAQESDVPNYASDLVQSPRLEATTTIAAHTADMEDVREYINDNGELDSLANDGAVVADREESDAPHNPVTLRADKFNAYEYREFPRGETFDEDGDGDADTDLNAVDAQHWATDTSGTAGSLTVETVEAANGENALHVTTASQTSGDVALATFTDFEITSGVDRKMAQLVANIKSLDSGCVTEVRIKDSAGNVITLVIDSSADSGAITTIATATATGLVYQEQIGEFTTSLDDIVELEIAVKDANIDLVLPAINLDKESEWEFGTQEFTNSDDELDSKTLKTPSGTFSITGLSSLPSVWTNAGIMDVQVDVEFRTEQLPSSQQKYRWADASRYDYANRLETLLGFELPTAYDLSYSSTSLRDEVLFPDSRYLTGEYATGQSEMPTWDDVDDGNVSWTDQTGTYENASVDDNITLTSSVSAGNLAVVHLDVQMSDDERDSATASGGGAGGGPTSSSGGLFSGVKGLAVSAVVGLLGYFGLSGMLGGD